MTKCAGTGPAAREAACLPSASATGWRVAGCVAGGPFVPALHLNAERPPLEALFPHKESTYPFRRRHSGRLRTRNGPNRTLRNYPAAPVRSRRALRAFRLALHLAPCPRRTAGLRVVASRLLAHLEDLRERRGAVGRRECRLRRRDADGRCFPVALRGGVRGAVRCGGALACLGAASRFVAWLAGSGVGCVAEHFQGLRASVTT